MKNKKAMTMYQVVLMVAALALLGVLLYVTLISGRQAKTIAELSPRADSTCYAERLKIAPGVQMRDIDNDKRPDTCDWCVCETGCHNDNDDKDGDKLPAKCDKNDDPKDGDEVVEFNEQNCDEDHMNIAKTQCFPS